MNPPNHTHLQRKLLQTFGISYAELILNQQGLLSKRQEQVLKLNMLNFLSSSLYRNVIRGMLSLYLLVAWIAINTNHVVLALVLLPAALLAAIVYLGDYLANSTPLGLDAKNPRLHRVAGHPIFLPPYEDKPDFISPRKRYYKLLVRGRRIEVTGRQYQLLKAIVERYPDQGFLFMVLSHSQKALSARLINMTADDFFSN